MLNSISIFSEWKNFGTYHPGPSYGDKKPRPNRLSRSISCLKWKRVVSLHHNHVLFIRALDFSHRLHPGPNVKHITLCRIIIMGWNFNELYFKIFCIKLRIHIPFNYASAKVIFSHRLRCMFWKIQKYNTIDNCLKSS